jgi:hypothetical protein
VESFIAPLNALIVSVVPIKLNAWINSMGTISNSKECVGSVKRKEE